MDRRHSSATHRATAVRTAGSAALDLLLPAAARGRGQPAADAPARRAVLEVSLLREPEDGRRVGDQSQTRATADAHSGHRSSLRQTQFKPPGAGSRSVSIPASRRGDRKTQPRLEHRYYLHSDAWRLSLPGRGDGLVQPLRAQLGTVQHDGNWLLRGRASCGIPLRPTRNLELRSGFAVHLGRLLGSAEEARNLHQHGWTRTRTRQRFHRAAVALAQVRTDLPRRFRFRQRSVRGAGKILPFLQLRTSVPGTRLPGAGGSVPTQTQEEMFFVVMGALPPWPPGFTAFVARMDAFRFTRNGTCRTIDLLARKIGLSRDGTRAPMQVRNGWRPSGRPLSQPVLHLRMDV